jgi:hypothetical protein
MRTFFFNVWSRQDIAPHLRKAGKFIDTNRGRNVCFLHPSSLMMRVPSITIQAFVVRL